MQQNSGRANFAVHVCVAGPGAFAGGKLGKKNKVQVGLKQSLQSFVCRM